MADKSIISIARETILAEAEAVSNLAGLLNQGFVDSVELILQSKGRVIVSGIGKSANIAQKIVATLNSTGTSSIFMHAADAIHGDLGIIGKDDVVVCISKSGSTPEIKVLVPLIKSLGNPIIALTGNVDSYLGKHADTVINASVQKEACPNNLAPTSSTTAQLVMGDALAVCLLNLKGFSEIDFARFHPGGSLGKKLYLTVDAIFRSNPVPVVSDKDLVRKVIVEISGKRLGATAVLDSHKRLIGIITDGDIRRMLEQNDSFNHIRAEEIMSANPKTISPSHMAIEAYQLMEKYKITQLIVSENDRYLGMIHLHDILKEGIV